MKIEEKNFGKLIYLIRYPNGYAKGKKYPVLFMLHGAGSRGTNTKALRSSAFFDITDKAEDFPMITVAPLCSENTWFDLFDMLKSFLHEISRADFTDSERIYCMGASMGGYATWQLAMSCPAYFAAIVPICGGGMYWNAGRLANVPVWAFHGCKDTVVFPEESQRMVDAVNRKNGNARLTLYSDNDHNAWEDTYSNPEVFSWMLSHKKKNATELLETHLCSKNFG